MFPASTLPSHTIAYNITIFCPQIFLILSQRYLLPHQGVMPDPTCCQGSVSERSFRVKLPSGVVGGGKKYAAKDKAFDSPEHLNISISRSKSAALLPHYLLLYFRTFCYLMPSALTRPESPSPIEGGGGVCRFSAKAVVRVFVDHRE